MEPLNIFIFALQPADRAWVEQTTDLLYSHNARPNVLPPSPLANGSALGNDGSPGAATIVGISAASSSKATPVGNQDSLILGSNGDREDDTPGFLVSIQAGATDDITPAEGQLTSDGVNWMQQDAGPSMASPLIYDDSIYILQGRGGTISCYDAKTGSPRYEGERLKGARQFWASPWGYDGKVFCLDQNGTTFVVEAGDKLNLLATNKIKGRFWSSPAMSEGGILLRGTERIYCIKNES